MIWTKEAHRSAKFQTLDCSHKISPNLYFDRFLKVYKILAKEIPRNFISWNGRLMQNLKKNPWSVVSKMTRIWWNLTRPLKSLKNFHFHLFLLCKVLNIWPKKVQRSHLSWHGRVMQNLKKNWFRKWYEKHGNFSPEHLKILKLGLWWDLLIQRRKSTSLKLTEELCVMTMKNDAKFEEKLTCRFKIDMRNLTNFDLSTWKSQKSSL